MHAINVALVKAGDSMTAPLAEGSLETSLMTQRFVTVTTLDAFKDDFSDIVTAQSLKMSPSGGWSVMVRFK